MTRAAFVVPKQPFGATEDGETQITRLLLGAAAASCSVVAVVLAERPARGPVPVELVEVPKPPVRAARLAFASARRRRSLIHVRFAPAALVRVLEQLPADVYVARRIYMAEAAIEAGRLPPRDRLVVLADVLESSVLRAARPRLGLLASAEAARTRRDELRCLREASEVAFLADDDAAEVGAFGARRLDLVFAPADAPASLEDPLAVFVGDRRNPANADAVARLLALWPTIARAAPGARLAVAGHPARRERLAVPTGVDVLGFVDDVDALWRSAAVLLAPVRIGGGVRVKILDAARHGVPVVGTRAAIGSTGAYLPVSPAEDFATDAARLLTDARERRQRGDLLFEANRILHARGFVEQQLAELLVANDAAARPPSETRRSPTG